MSQGAEKSQPQEVGIEPGPPDLKATQVAGSTGKHSTGFYRKAVEVCYNLAP